jgi:hypothetical protein
MVNEFVNDNLGCWDKEMLEENLNAPDMATVSPIPIGHFTEDLWASTQEKTRIFSVISCYMLLSTKCYFNNNASSSNGVALLVWKKLWKLDVPPKIRNFLVAGHQ